MSRLTGGATARRSLHTVRVCITRELQPPPPGRTCQRQQGPPTPRLDKLDPANADAALGRRCGSVPRASVVLRLVSLPHLVAETFGATRTVIALS